MNPDTLPLVISLGVALTGILLLTAVTGRNGRRRDPRRFSSWPDKRLLVGQAGGRCEHKPLLWRRCPKPGTEADHIVPWSRGGRTDVSNGQLLCRRHNARKSNALPARSTAGS